LAHDARRMCQGIRTYQNLVSFFLVSIVGVAYVFSIWDRTDRGALLFWYLSFSSLAIIRAYVYESVRRSLDTASPSKLLRNEVSLLITGLVVSLWLGMSYWIVGIPGDEHTVLAITILICVYATGTTINTATQTRHLLIYLTAILGQAILFWAWLGNRTDYALALLLSCLFVLLYAFALRNRNLIIESVKIRLENKAHNERLIENRLLVENALESALEANRSKSHFIATVSHDLAQPVHALTYLLQSLKSALDNNSAHHTIVEKIESSVDMLERQFSGFVDLSRYDASDLEVRHRQFDLTAVCRILVENAKASAVEDTVEISLHGDPVFVVSDSVLMGRVVGNLLDNAVKFGRGQVFIRISAHADWAVVEVEDAGSGISAEDLPKIFGDFVQLEYQAESSSVGAGLGLAIVRRIADALSLEMFVDSRVGEGTTFTLLVPLEPLPGEMDKRNFPVVSGRSIREIANGGATLAVPRVNLRGKVILLVDDEPGNTDSLAGYISDLGGQSIAAATVDEALSLVESNAVDLVIVADRPGSVSSRLTSCAKLASKLGEDRIVMVTANDSKQRLKEFEKAGFSVLAKPLKATQLQAIVSARLGIGLN